MTRESDSTFDDRGATPDAEGMASPSRESESQRKDYKKIYSLAVLHMAQYFPQGFTQSALPAIFRQQGLPLEQFWLLSVPTWPRWIKFLMAIVIDNVGNEKFGYRRSWILPCTRNLGAVVPESRLCSTSGEHRRNHRHHPGRQVAVHDRTRRRGRCLL